MRVAYLAATIARRHDQRVHHEDLSDGELGEIEALARSATPGPWRWFDSFTLATADGAGVLTKRRNREYVQRMTPDLALRLVDEVRFLRRLEQIRASTTPPPARRSAPPRATKSKR